MITTAQWDTENFGIKVGNLSFEGEITAEKLCKIREIAQKDDYDLLYIKGGKIPAGFLDNNLLLADQKVVYSKCIMEQSEACDAVSVLHHPLSEDLLSLAYESGKYSRYRLDSQLPLHIFPTLYRLWMSRSLSGEIADNVLAIQDGKKNIAMLTYKYSDGVYDIGLVAVSPDYAGKGVGSKLMKSFFAMLEPGSEVNVATQKQNSVACHYYEKNGFTVKSITNIYHLWVR